MLIGAISTVVGAGVPLLGPGGKFSTKSNMIFRIAVLSSKADAFKGELIEV